MFIQQNQIKFFGREHVSIIDLCPLSDINSRVAESCQFYAKDDFNDHGDFDHPDDHENA